MDSRKQQPERQHIIYRMETTALTLGLICTWFDMWWLYTSDQTRPVLLDRMNHFPNYFRSNAEAQMRSMMTAIVTLYDRGKGRLTLASLIRDTAMPEASNVRLTRLYRIGAALTEKIEAIRHNLIAHRSERHTYADAYNQAQITPNQIMRIITLSCVIYNGIARATSSPVFYRQYRARTEMLELIQLIDVHGKPSA